jgi:hypothetical protein
LPVLGFGSLGDIPKGPVRWRDHPACDDRGNLGWFGTRVPPHLSWLAPAWGAATPWQHIPPLLELLARAEHRSDGAAHWFQLSAHCVQEHMHGRDPLIVGLERHAKLLVEHWSLPR